MHQRGIAPGHGKAHACTNKASHEAMGAPMDGPTVLRWQAWEGTWMDPLKLVDGGMRMPTLAWESSRIRGGRSMDMRIELHGSSP
jgi:hypothetical protein